MCVVHAAHTAVSRSSRPPNKRPMALIPVALDAMGGDHAPSALVDGACRAVRAGIPVTLVGDEHILRPLIPKGIELPVVHASETVGMDESPSAAVRSRKDCSIRVAARELAEGRACGVVSCGNTGAVMAASLIELGRIEGVERPAVVTTVPRTDGGQVVILDLGANVDCKPSHLGQFGVMGQVFARDVLSIENPRVGLLSNGEEDGTGNEQVRAAPHELGHVAAARERAVHLFRDDVEVLPLALGQRAFGRRARAQRLGAWRVSGL